jgi:DNA helicase-2/ATP-dependent DNA helicase PcrA
MLKLNEEQQSVVDHDSYAPLLVLAAAGTGKTQAITCRIAHLILDKKVSPYDILAITFTRKAAAEMRNRTAMLCDMDEGRFGTIGTFHGMCNSILRRNVSKTLLKPGFDILSVKSSKELLDGLLEEACAASCINDQAWIREFLTARKLESASSVLQKIEEWRAKSIEPGDPVVQVNNLEKVAFHAFQLYRNECLRSNAIDFSDIIALTNGLLENLKIPYYSHVIVDEFQDTNLAQLKLVRLLTGPQTQLVVVGDDYQAIHEWRGATVRNILEFEKTFPNARTLTLSQNYRSKAGILELASRLIAHNKYQRHKLLVPTRVSTACVEVRRTESPEEEAKLLVKIALAMTDKIAVLYRINAQSCPFEEALRSAGISFIVRGGRAFFQRPEISAMLAMAGLASKGYVDDRTFEVLFLSSKGLGQKSLEKLKVKKLTNGRTLLSEALEAVGKRLLKFARSLETVSKIPEGTKPKDVVRAIIELMGFQSRESEDESPQANAEALLRISSRFTTMEEFLDYCALATTDENSENSDAQMTAHVELMTIHSSKGLEFPCVFIAGCSEGQFPDFRAVRDGKVEEERRLCYVGVTRAKDTLYISSPNRVWARPARESRFLTEMGLFVESDFT